MDLTFTLTTDWRWKMLASNEEGYSKSVLEDLQQKFIKRMLTVYLRPSVDTPVVVASNATIDFDVGVRCAVSDLCGLPFWWRHEGVLRIIFDSMSKEVACTDFDDVRTRACETLRIPRETTVPAIDYPTFLDYMTTVAEKNMGLRDWSSHRGVQAYKRNKKKLPPKNRALATLPLLRKNAVFDYQAGAAVGFVDRMFKRGEFEGATKFPVTKVEGVEVEDEVEDDPWGRWVRVR